MSQANTHHRQHRAPAASRQDACESRSLSRLQSDFVDVEEDEDVDVVDDDDDELEPLEDEPPELLPLSLPDPLASEDLLLALESLSSEEEDEEVDELARPLAEADDARESVMYQPLPLKTM